MGHLRREDAGRVRTARADATARLTRDARITEYLGRGWSLRQIANELAMSPEGVRRAIARIGDERAAAVARAAELAERERAIVDEISTLLVVTAESRRRIARLRRELEAIADERHGA